MIKDEVLAKRALEGDSQAFDGLIHRYHHKILIHLECLLKDHDKAQDLLQETFLKLHRQLLTSSIPLNIRAWLYCVATNLCRDYWRSTKYRREMQILDQIPEPWDQNGQVIDIFERRESRSEIRHILNELPELQKQIIILRFYNDLKLREIAVALSCPIGTVKSRLFHALRYLKYRIEEKGNVSYG